MKRRSQHGVALVITLIMLSIITIITVAFLAVTTRETGAVANSTFQLTTKDLTDGALERARAEILSYIMANTNRLGPDLLVSLNDLGATNLYDPLVSLWQDGDPRPPVFVTTNSSPPAAEFRFWLDLDRNGLFTPTGFLQVIDEFGNVLSVTNYQVGDPHWIGVLQDPLRPHGRENRFVGRYAFVVLPAGRTLDANFIHNNAKGRSNLIRRTDEAGFLRNQGAGSWEINLAAFLADLNTNAWNTYLYVQDPGAPSGGLAFDHATELLSWRYNGSWQNLRPATTEFPLKNASFTADLIDAYANGPILPPGMQAVLADDANDDPTRPWPGSDGVRHFHSLHDFFRVTGLPTHSNFVNRLRQATMAPGTYNQTTFYRMLSMMATDSAPEEEDPFREKININYVSSASTNLVEWDAPSSGINFFRETADRLLEDEFGDEISIYRIPVYTNSSSKMSNGVAIFSPRIHQLLQLAANITDARRAEKDVEAYPFYPSVFRPQFEVVSGANEVYITNFVEDPAGTAKMQYQPPWYDIMDPFDIRNTVPVGNPDVNFYGIPSIIGAKKGFPSFNELTTLTTVQVGRKIELRKVNAADPRPSETNQMFTIGISNQVAVELWNSYRDPYPRALELVVANVMTTTLRNDAGLVLVSQMRTNHSMMLPPQTWSGTRGQDNEINKQSFLVTPEDGLLSLPESVYYVTPTPHFERVGPTNRFEANRGIYTNAWGLDVTNKLLCFLYDGGRLVEMVALSDLSVHFPISEKLAEVGGADSRFWSLAPSGSVTRGMLEQIDVSRGANTDAENLVWTDYGTADASLGGGDVKLSMDKFQYFIDREVEPRYGSEVEDLQNSLSTVAQAPFTPLRRMYAATTWEANDPLVQDRSEHLQSRPGEPDTEYPDVALAASLALTNVGSLGARNARYKPWADSDTSASSDPLLKNPAVKDPGVYSSDFWNFPNGKFPSIGWLGRVHRGTPWQTVYLKAGVPGTQDWAEHVGAANMGGSMPTRPHNDRRVVDLFSAALHPNATRGTLSVNQSGLAAWSAVLSGASASTLRDVSGTIIKESVVIEPALNDPRVQEIVDGIARIRAAEPGGRFETVGSILAAPELTDGSPFLNIPYVPQSAEPWKDRMLTDQDYERIPEQILSLLKVGDARFVVYAFGQSLSPAPNSIPASGPYFGVCNNYEVTGESANRAVVRVDFDRDLDGRPSVTNAHARIERFNAAAIE